MYTELVIRSVVIAVVIGLFMSIFSLVLLLWRRPQFGRTARKVAVLCLAGLAFFIAYPGFGYLGAIANFAFGVPRITHRGHIWENGEIVGDAYDEGLRRALQSNKPAIMTELWMREIVPPPFRRDCFARNATVCDLSDQLVYPSEPAPTEPVWLLGQGLLAGLVCGTICVWLLGMGRDRGVEGK